MWSKDKSHIKDEGQEDHGRKTNREAVKKKGDKRFGPCSLLHHHIYR